MRSALRRHRALLLVLAALVLAVVITALLSRDDATYSADLDPANPGPDGAQAVARVLDGQGVAVRVVRDADTFDGSALGPDAAVVVTSTWQLGQTTARRLLDHAAGSPVILVDPTAATLEALDVDLSPSTAVDESLPARCRRPAYEGLTIRLDQATVYDGVPGCFRTAGGAAALVEPRPGLFVLGAGAVLSNDEVLRSDNAAVALRLLGGADRLVWYVPTLADVEASDTVGAGSLLPRWLRPALALVTIAVVALMLWRGRRLGPLVTEPLPVVVKAIETTRSRGRLYRRSGDRGHAAAVLRAAARGRAAEALRLGRHAPPEVVVRDLALRLDRPHAEIEQLLGVSAPTPATDRELVALATQLAELDREVRRP